MTTSSPAPTQEQAPSQAEISVDQLFDVLSQHPSFQAIITSAVAKGVEDVLAAKELNAQEDFVLNDDFREVNYDPATRKTTVTVTPRTSEDESYENRVQKGREGASNLRARRSIGEIFPENTKAEVKKPNDKIRPYTAILHDIHVANTEKAADPARDPQAEFILATEAEMKHDMLTDELAAHITLQVFDASINEDDARNDMLIDLKKRGLTNEDISIVIDKIDNFDLQLTTAANLVDEIMKTELEPAFKALVEAGRKPAEFFRDSAGAKTDEFDKMDKKFRQILNEIENPIIRQEVLRGINKELKDYQKIANENAAKAPKPTPATDTEPKLTDTEPELSDAELLEQQINIRAEAINLNLVEQAKEGGMRAALDDLYNHVNEGKNLTKHVAEQQGKKSPIKFSDSPSGKAIIRGVSKFVENHWMELVPDMSSDEVDAYIALELQQLRDIFDMHEQPAPAPALALAPAPKAPNKGNRVLKATGSALKGGAKGVGRAAKWVNNYRKPGMNPTGK